MPDTELGQRMADIVDNANFDNLDQQIEKAERLADQAERQGQTEALREIEREFEALAQMSFRTKKG